MKKINFRKKNNLGIIIPVVLMTSVLIGLGTYKGRINAKAEILNKLEALANIDGMGSLSPSEIEIMDYACGLTNESVFNNGKPNYNIGLNKLKQGIEYYNK
jgi:hypothetical protein